MSESVTAIVIAIIVFIITGLIMSKRSIYTTITPLPEGVTRETVLETLHTHTEMIDLNPLVKERHPIKPPAKASPEEYHCQWYEITDTIQYLPGGVLSGSVSYDACFHDLADGIQTHIYAPLGLEIRGRWTIGGSLPGEPQGPIEIGKGIPLSGLYLREDCNVKCNILLAGTVKKNMKSSHAGLVQRIVARAQLQDATEPNNYSSRSEPRTAPTSHNFASYQDPAYESLVQQQQQPHDENQNLYPAPLNLRSQTTPQQQGYDPRFSSQTYGGTPNYQQRQLDPVASSHPAATNPHWQPQIPVQTQPQTQYRQYQDHPHQQTGYATSPQKEPTKDKKGGSRGGAEGYDGFGGGPPTHPGRDLDPGTAELQ